MTDLKAWPVSFPACRIKFSSDLNLVRRRLVIRKEGLCNSEEKAVKRGRWIGGKKDWRYKGGKMSG